MIQSVFCADKTMPGDDNGGLDTLMQDIFERAPLLKLIGNTPLLPLEADADVSDDVRLFAKMEGFNPGGSVKDRAAFYMVRKALQTGELGKDRILLDSTSGNTGIAYAMIGAALGIPVELCLPANASDERKQLIKAYGGTIHETDPLEGSEGSRVIAAQMMRQHPDKYFLPDQYNNDENPRAHFETTGPEIWRQTDGLITHFVAGIGTSGTLMGTGRYLKSVSQDVGIFAAEPDDAFHGLEGLKHMASADVPGIYDPSWLDGVIPVSTENAYRRATQLARQGILVGISSGAAYEAAITLARSLDRGTVVTVFPDGGSRYLSTELFGS